MRNGTTTWTYTYGPDGMRTSRSNGTTTWNYVYNGSQLMAMTNRDNTISMYFTYDAAGRPVSIEYNGAVFYYVLNAQGDVIMIVDSNGLNKVTYTYDAWGKHTTPANGLGKYNPLRYRGYVYDVDTGLYYLQSRYYNPEMGRFINADSYASTGQGILGNNMFAYCNNNPVVFKDIEGMYPSVAVTAVCKDGAGPRYGWSIAGNTNSKVDKIIGEFIYANPFNTDENVVLASEMFSYYRGVPVFRIKGKRSGSFICMFITNNANNLSDPEDIVRHEYGHALVLQQLGVENYALTMGIPSWRIWGTGTYYSKPWETIADLAGNVQSRNHSQAEIQDAIVYTILSKLLGPYVWLFIE